MPWYIALVLSIIVIIVSLARKINIGLSMILGATVLGLTSGTAVKELFYVAYQALKNSTTIILVLSIVLLGALGHVLKQTGSMEQMIKSINTLIADLRVVTAAIPFLIGMLTVPGGAILSAPMCGELGHKLNLPPARRVVVNIWFRHVSYFMLPLFPGVIMASELSGASVTTFFVHNFHLTVIGTLAGFFFLFRGYSKGPGKEPLVEETNAEETPLRELLNFCQSILPIVTIMFLVVFFNLYFPLALLLGVLTALFNYLPQEGKGQILLHRLKTMVLPGINLRIVLVIVGIMFYKEMLNYTRAVFHLTEFLLYLGIPLIFLILTVPFLIGMLAGDSSASVGIVFPLFLPLLPQDTNAYPAYLAFLYVCSTAGHIISPAHPCFALTKEYFAADIKESIKLMLPLLLLVTLTAFVTTLFFGFY